MHMIIAKIRPAGDKALLETAELMRKERFEYSYLHLMGFDSTVTLTVLDSLASQAIWRAPYVPAQ
jgi:hypothetical protein